jgi:hypothetical protein
MSDARELVYERLRERGLDPEAVARRAEENFRTYRLNDRVTCSCCLGRPSLGIAGKRFL